MTKGIDMDGHRGATAVLTRRFAAVALGAALVLGGAACSSSQNQNQNDQHQQPQQQQDRN